MITGLGEALPPLSVGNDFGCCASISHALNITVREYTSVFCFFFFTIAQTQLTN